MSLVIKRSPTVTGGTDATYTPDGYQPNGKARFIGPENTFLTPEVLLIGASATNPTKDSLGRVSTTHQLVFGDRSTEDGCCTVSANQASANLSVDWTLGLSSGKVDAFLVDLRAYINSPAFVTAVKTGVRPV